MYYRWNNVMSKTEADFILRSIKEKIGEQRIKRIFSFDDCVPELNDGDIYYDLLDEDLYILFENGWCFIIGFYNPSVLYLDYRKVSEEELKNSISSVNKKEIDYFDTHHEVYGWDFDGNGNRIEESFRVKHIRDFKGEYDLIKSIETKGFNDEFVKWVYNGSSHQTVKIPAGGDYFDEIIITLNNNVRIRVCPYDADLDGYYQLFISGPYKCIQYSFKEL